MGKNIPLAEMMRGQRYQITGFNKANDEYTNKLNKMGFIIGTKIELSPVDIKDPIMIQIRGSRIALRKNECNDITVEIV
ncbi:MAG: ferrous iron transport protein A [Desulfotalea sp.]